MYCAHNLWTFQDIVKKKKKNSPEIKLKDFIKSCTPEESNHEKKDPHLPTLDFNYLFDRYFWTNRLSHYQM